MWGCSSLAAGPASSTATAALLGLHLSTQLWAQHFHLAAATQGSRQSRCWIPARTHGGLGLGFRLGLGGARMCGYLMDGRPHQA